MKQTKAAGQMHVVVVGGGISGIASAYYLHKRGITVTLLERDARLGGRVGPTSLDGHAVDLGGKNIGKKYRRFREFVAAMGNHQWCDFGFNSTAVENGKLLTVDSKSRVRGLVKTMAGASVQDYTRFARMALAVRTEEANRYVGGPYFARWAEQSEEPRASQLFGDAFCRRVVRPMTVRMNGAEPDEIYVGTLGTNIGLIFDDYEQLGTGMGTVFEALSKYVTVRTETAVVRPLFEGGKVVGVRVRDAKGEHDVHADAVVFATPAYATAVLVREVDAELSRALEKVRYMPVATVVAKYEHNVFSPEVRAFRFDAKSPLSNAGAYGPDKLNIVRYTFSGESGRHPVMNEADDELLRRGESTIAGLSFLKGHALSFATGRWERGLCAYSKNHSQTIEYCRRKEDAIPGLWLAGDYVSGVSIEACFVAAEQTVNKMLESSEFQTFAKQAPWRAA